jgi:hypothetical protein
MQRLAPVAVLLAFLLGGPLLGQGGTTKKPKVTADQVPGYKPMVVEGFTVILSAETLNHLDDTEFEKKPLAVLEGELRTICDLMPAKSLKQLQNVLIWVEWDERLAMSNGRAGNAVAVYYGGHQAYMLARGMPPLKAKNVTVLKMKSLTQEHQPKRDSGRCVLLHEIAHAVHDQVLPQGRDNPVVKSAFKQALERKLVDPKAYAATNEMEFFAEMSCAYNNQLDYYPKDRAALKKHDPVTYKVMEDVWHKTKVATTNVAKTITSIDAPPLAAVNLGSKTIQGDLLKADRLIGKPAVVVYWHAANVSSLSALTKLQSLDRELSDHGLTIVAVHLTGPKVPDIKGALKARDIRLPTNEGPWIDGKIVDDFKDFPVCLVYSHEGNCLYRGSPFEGETAIRSAVGDAIVAATGLTSIPKSLVPIVNALRAGKAPATQFANLSALAKTKDDDAAPAAKQMIDKLTERGQKALDEIEPTIKDAPVDAFLKLEQLSSTYKYSPVATKANAHLAILRVNKGVAEELKARPSLTAIKKMETELSSKPGSFDVRSPRFRRENGPLLRQLEAAISQMKRQYPDARATEQAIAAGERFGIAAP